MLLDNDLAGDKVVINQLLTNTHYGDQSPDNIKQEIPDLYPLPYKDDGEESIECRIQDIELHVTDTFIGQSFHGEI